MNTSTKTNLKFQNNYKIEHTEEHFQMKNRVDQCVSIQRKVDNTLPQKRLHLQIIRTNFSSYRLTKYEERMAFALFFCVVEMIMSIVSDGKHSECLVTIYSQILS